MSIWTRLRNDRRLTIASATGFVVFMILLYVLLRHVADSRLALIVSQFVYCAAPAAAAAACFTATRRAPSTAVRARAAWRLFGLTTAMLFVTETSYSITMLWPQAHGVMDVVSDVTAAIAVALIFAALVKVSGTGRLGWRAVVLQVVDAIALGSLAFVLLFRYWMLPVLHVGSGVSVTDAVRPTLYAVAGIVMLVATVVSAYHTGVSLRRPWTAITASGIGIYSLGLTLWPVWSLAAEGVRPDPLAEALVSTMLFTGYWLLFMGGLVRVAYSERPWNAESSVGQRGHRAWPDMVVTSVALSSVLALGASALFADGGSLLERVYIAALAVASLTLVVRTTLQSAEVSDLIERSTTDAVTGARNLRSMRERFAYCATLHRRKSRPFGIVVLDLDGFGAVNDLVGWQEGDRLLAQVASALAAHTGEPAFRLSSDEFALVVSVKHEQDLDHYAKAAADAVRSVRGPHGQLTASIGWSSCPADGTELDTLLSKADRARSWARRHGRGNVVHYDARIAHPATAGEWQQFATEQARIDVARALAAASDARDPANFVHSRNVAALSVLLAEEIGLDADEMRRVEMAGLLHDVGKIALPDSGTEGTSLGRRAQARLRDHPVLGEQLTQALGVPGLAQAVRSHHERWDGTGYPDGLSGEQIPLISRIIALADAYDAMTVTARNGGCLSKGAALQEIDLGIGSRFDPHLAERFIIAVATTEALGWSDEWPAA